MLAPAIDLGLLKVAKYKCKKSLLFFTRYFFKKNNGGRKYVVRHHHQKMADALELVLKGKLTRLGITIPPRYGKTELGVVAFIAHGLALNPSAKFMHLSATAALALENSEKIKDLVKSAAYQEMFPEVQIKQDTDSKAKWYTTAGGGVYAAGAAGQVTGFGAGQTDSGELSGEPLRVIGGDPDLDYEDAVLKDIEAFINEIETKEGFAGAIVIDDPVKPDDADSDVKRIRVNNRYISTIKNRLNSRKTPIVIIMQRLHATDLIGHVQTIEPGEWTIVDIPALWVDENGQLQCLDPTKHTVEDLQKMENNPDPEVRIVFQRQYQQNPMPREGLMFPLQDLKLYDPSVYNPADFVEFKFNYTDPANKGGDDLCSIMAYLVKDMIYVVDVIYNTKGTDINGPAIVEMCARHNANAAQMEANFKVWKDFGNSVRNSVRKVLPNCTMYLFQNSVNKHTRILAQSSFIRNHFVFRKDWQLCSQDYRKFMINLVAYKMVQTATDGNAHDDAPDATAGTGAYFTKTMPHLWPVQQVG